MLQILQAIFYHLIDIKLTLNLVQMCEKVANAIIVSKRYLKSAKKTKLRQCFMTSNKSYAPKRTIRFQTFSVSIYKVTKLKYFYGENVVPEANIASHFLIVSKSFVVGAILSSIMFYCLDFVFVAACLATLYLLSAI